jgi:hypothetical protein
MIPQYSTSETTPAFSRTFFRNNITDELRKFIVSIEANQKTIQTLKFLRKPNLGGTGSDQHQIVESTNSVLYRNDESKFPPF